MSIIDRWYCPQCGSRNVVGGIVAECWQCSTPRPGISAVAYRTPACDKHLNRTDDPECPWCKLDRCEELLATAYQLAGLVGAPERFLDAYSRQEGGIDSLLPVELSELDEFKELSSRLDSAENAMREVVSHLQHSQRGSTHWAGCTDVHPVCQAIDMLVNALPSRDVEKLSPKSQSHGVNDVNLEPR